MIPYRFDRIMSVPQTPHARLEIANAIRTFVAQDDDAWSRRRAEIVDLRRDIEALRRDVKKFAEDWSTLVKAELRAALKKYSPDQPRVPAGNTDGGQWTSDGDKSPDDSTTARGDTANGISNPRVRYAALDTGTRTDASGEEESTIQVAAGPGRPGYPVDLQEDEGFGHTIRDHVGKSEEYLLSVGRDFSERAERLGDSATGLREGSFPSLEAANKLVNSTLSQNQDKVDLVANGVLNGAQLDADFGSSTGYEVFVKTERSTPYIRDTYGVHVVIARDSNSPKGYRVFTAFPVNR